jgi:hypothetical protein
MTMLPAGASVVPQALYPSWVMRRELLSMYLPFSFPRSSGVIHTMWPSQYSGLLLEGVAPFRMCVTEPSRRTSQCSGTLPSHGTPESL